MLQLCHNFVPYNQVKKMTLQKLTPDQITDFKLNAPDTCLVNLAEMILSYRFIEHYNPNVWEAAEIILERYKPKKEIGDLFDPLIKLVNGEFMAPLPKIPKKPVPPGCKYCGGFHESHLCQNNMD